MRRLHLTALLLAASVIASTCLADEKTPAEPPNGIPLMKFEALDGSYSLELPVSWDLKLDVKGFETIAFSPRQGSADAYLENISISISEDKDSDSSKEAAEKLKESIKGSVEGFKTIGETPCKLSGADAIRLEYSYEPGNVRIMAQDFILLKGGKAYRLSFKAASGQMDSSEAAFKAALDSFKLK